MQSSAANEHLQLCNITVAHLCLLNSSHPPTGPQTAADSLPVLGSERGLCRVIHAVNQGLGVSRVPTDTYDQLLSVKHLGATSKWSLDSNLKAHLLLPSEGNQLLLAVLLVLLSPFYQQVDELPDILVVEEL